MQVRRTESLVQGGWGRRKVLAQAERNLPAVLNCCALVHIQHTNDLPVHKRDSMVLVLGLGLRREGFVGTQGTGAFNHVLHLVGPSTHDGRVTVGVLGVHQIPLVKTKELLVEHDLDVLGLGSTILRLIDLMADDELELGAQKLLELRVVQLAGLGQGSVFQGGQQLQSLTPVHDTTHQTDQSLTMIGSPQAALQDDERAAHDTEVPCEEGVEELVVVQFGQLQVTA
mmetsp:Transcript_137156/g.238523  ORF Transcript_137156/g.238523 Transcript_137156/m.238523 type:complete len:227 (-) Transcript_137156:4125-4805(-)